MLYELVAGYRDTRVVEADLRRRAAALHSDRHPGNLIVGPDQFAVIDPGPSVGGADNGSKNGCPVRRPLPLAHGAAYAEPVMSKARMSLLLRLTTGVSLPARSTRADTTILLGTGGPKDESEPRHIRGSARSQPA